MILSLLFFLKAGYLNLIQYSFWSIVLNFFIKKYIIIFIILIFWINKNFTLPLLMGTSKLWYKYKLYTIVNFGLLNNYLFIHPTLLYSYLIAKTLYLWEKNISLKFYKKRFLVNLGLIILTNIFGLCWARSEVLWNGPWSWDEIEVGLLSLLLITLYLFHRKSSDISINIWAFIVVYIFLKPKFDNIISPHQFSKNNFSQTPFILKIWLISNFLNVVRLEYKKYSWSVLFFIGFISVSYLFSELKYWAIFLQLFYSVLFGRWFFFITSPLLSIIFFQIIKNFSLKLPNYIFFPHKILFFIILVGICELFSFPTQEFFLIKHGCIFNIWGLYYTTLSHIYLQNYCWRELFFL